MSLWYDNGGLIMEAAGLIDCPTCPCTGTGTTGTGTSTGTGTGAACTHCPSGYLPSNGYLLGISGLTGSMSCQACSVWDGTYVTPYFGTAGYCYGIASTRTATCGFNDNWQIDVQWRIHDSTIGTSTVDAWRFEVIVKAQASFDATRWTQVNHERIFDMNTECNDLSAHSIAYKSISNGPGGVGPCTMTGLTITATAY